MDKICPFRNKKTSPTSQSSFSWEESVEKNSFEHFFSLSFLEADIQLRHSTCKKQGTTLKSELVKIFPFFIKSSSSEQKNWEAVEKWAGSLLGWWWFVVVAYFQACLLAPKVSILYEITRAKRRFYFALATKKAICKSKLLV